MHGVSNNWQLALKDVFWRIFDLQGHWKDLYKMLFFVDREMFILRANELKIC